MKIRYVLDASLMTIDGLGAADLFLLWALRQQPIGDSRCYQIVSAGLRSTLGEHHTEPALAALFGTSQVLAALGEQRPLLLPPRCGFVTHDELRLLSLCSTAQSGLVARSREEAHALAGPRWSRDLVISLTRLTRVFADCSLHLSSSPCEMRRAFH